MGQQPTPRAITHVGLTVPDIDSAVQWYREVLGFQHLQGPYTREGRNERIAREIIGDFDEMRVAHLATGNQVGFELFEFPGQDPPSEPTMLDEYRRGGPHHVCVVDPDIESFLDRVEAHGGERIATTYRPAPDESYEFAYCTDPWNNYIEVFTHSHEQFVANRDG